jgi:Protein of unknown function (DUF3892)
MAGKRIKVTNESDSGRNQVFKDTRTGKEMTREQLVKQIEQGTYPNYHVREVNGIKTPVSNPDQSENNNLG